MDCPTENDLRAYLSGELNDNRRDDIEGHIENCQRCASKLAKLDSAGEGAISRPQGLAGPTEIEGLDPQIASELDEAGYAVIGRIGKGGFGTVFRAREIDAARDVAIKVLNADRLHSDTAASRFMQEINTLANINRDGIVPVYKASRFQNGQHYMVMPFLENSLRALIEQNGKGIHHLRAAGLIKDVAEAVHFLHSKGLVHLDLKPDNILLNEQGEPCVADFGLAAAVIDLHAGDASVGHTPAYASPEQVHASQGRQTGVIGASSDIWSLGAVLYELLTGQPPSKGNSKADIAEASEPYEPTGLPRAIPPVLGRIVMKCLRKLPSERFDSARELADALKNFIRIEERDYNIPQVWSLQKKHREGFTGRIDVLQQLESWVEQAVDNRYCLLLGPRGQGKSALLAEFSYQQGARRDDPTGPCLYHSIKTNWDPRRFLQFLVWQGQRLLRTPLEECTYSGDIDELRNSLVNVLQRIVKERGRVLLIVDGLDELTSDSGAIDFLPQVLPEGVRCILSCRPNIPRVRHLKHSFDIDDANTIDLPPFTRSDFDRYVEKTLGPTRVSQLQSQQGVDLTNLLEATGGNALLIRHNIRRIRNACDEAVRAGHALPAFERSSFARTEAEVFAEIYDEIAERTPGRRSTQTQRGRDKATILQLLSVAYEGLSLQQIRGLLHVSGRRLSLDDTRDLVDSMSEYLVGEEQFMPFLAGLADYVCNEVLAPDEVADLHKLFCEFLQGASQSESEYRLRYQPSHLLTWALGCTTKGAAKVPFDQLAELLTDLEFLEAKIGAGLIFNLVQDCRETGRRMPVDRLDAHVFLEMARCFAAASSLLTRHPGCVFQSLWNHCFQNTHRPFPGLLRKWRTDWESRTPGAPWVRLLRKFPEDDPTVLHRLVGPQAPVLHIVATEQATAAFAADGRLYIWDESGYLQHKMEGKECGFFVPIAFDVAGIHLLVATRHEFRVLDLRAMHESELWIARTQRTAMPLCGVADNNSIRVLLSDGTLAEWTRHAGFTISTIANDVVLRAGVLSESGCWLAITDAAHLIGSIHATVIHLEIPDEVWQAMNVGRDRGIFGQAHLDLFCRSVATSLLKDMHALWQPYIALHATTGWVAVLQEVETDIAEVEECDLYTKNAVMLWQPTLGQSIMTKHWSGESCERVAMARDEQLLAVGMTDGRIRAIALDTRSDVWTCKVHDDQVSALTWRHSDNALVSSGSSGCVPQGRGNDNQVIVRCVNRKTTQPSGVHLTRVTSICCSPDGRLFASGDEAGCIALWNAADGSLRHFQMPKRIFWLDNERKKTDDAEQGIVEVWNGHRTSISRLAFTPDSRLLVTASEDANVWLWAAESGEAVGNVSVASDIEVSPAQCWMDISADGRIVAAMDASGAVGVWNIANEIQEILRVGPNDTDGGPLTLSQDGRLLVTVHRIRPEMDHNAPIEQQIINSYKYHIVARDLERGEITREWRTSFPSALFDLRVALLETQAAIPLLVLGAGDWNGEIWRVRIWSLSDDEPVFDQVLPGSIGGFEFVLQTINDRIGVSSPRTVEASTWRARPWKEHGETAFGHAGKDEETAWYNVAFDAIVGAPCGQLFCGYSGRDLHFLRLEGTTVSAQDRSR